MQKKVTFNLESKVYSNFQNFCEQNDIIISKKVERLLKEFIEKQGANKK